MKTVRITEFYSNPKSYLQQVADDQDILKISMLKKNEGFVIMTRNEYESLKETAYLLSTLANTRRLMESIAQHKASEATPKKLVTKKILKKVK